MRKEKKKNYSPEDITPDLYILTKHPPQTHQSSAELSKLTAHFKPETDEDLNKLFWKQLLGLGLEFKKTGNPIYAFEAFLYAHKAGVHPPIWVTNYMAEGINDWLALQGTKSLDEIFELKPIRGQAPLCKKDKEERRDEMLCKDVFALNTFFDFTIEEACYMAARRLEESDNWNKTSFDLKAISAETIKDRYKRKWGKIIRFLYHSGDLPELDQKEDKIAFLKRFPEDSFPVNKPLNQIIKKVV